MASRTGLTVAAALLIAALAFVPLAESARHLHSDDADEHGFKYMFKHAGEHLGERLGEHADITWNAFNQQYGEHVTPRMQEWTHKFDDYAKEGKELFMHYEHKLEDQVAPYVGPQYSKMVSWLFIVILVALPGAMVACFVLDKISSALSLEKMLVFTNAYGVAYFALLLMITTMGIGEPMAILQQNNSDGYIIFQLAVALVYGAYLLVHLGMLCSVQLMFVALIRMASCVGMGLHYYMAIWQPAMLDQPPKLGNPVLVYVTYAMVYMVNCLLPSVPIAGGHAIMGLLEDEPTARRDRSD